MNGSWTENRMREYMTRASRVAFSYFCDVLCQALILATEGYFAFAMAAVREV